jgi:hypothetical protein
MSFSPMENTCIADSNRLLKSGNTLLQSAMLSYTNTDSSKFLFAAPYLLLTADFVCGSCGVSAEPVHAAREFKPGSGHR